MSDVSNTYAEAAPVIKNEKDILDEELRKKLIQHWNTARNVRRKNEAFKAYECLKDKTNNYVMELLLRQFDLNTVIEMQYAITNVSILRKVIDKLAKVYGNGAKRTMPRPEPKPVDVEAPPKPTLMGKVKAAIGLVPAPAKPLPANAPMMTDMQAPEGAMPAKPVDPNAPQVPADPNAPQTPTAPTAPTAPAAQTPGPTEAQLEAEDPKTEALEKFCEYLEFDKRMKKCNRYYRTFFNTLAYAKPVPDGTGKFDIKIEIVPPFHYDVVEQPGNPEQPLAIVLSDYTPIRRTLYYLGDAAVAGRGVRAANVLNAPVQDFSTTSGIVNAQDNADDKREWVWWTKNYHFTTDKNGKIIDSVSTAPDDVIDNSNANPIGELPFENFAGEQDGAFWAEGGTDLVESAIGINTDLTNIRAIGTGQGYGQLYMTGENLPKSVKVGPTHCIQLEHTKDQADPTIGFLNSNAPLAELKTVVEMEVALMLTTNNLSTSSVASSLSGNKDFASGIALMIDKSESIEDINETAKIFIAKEPKVLSKAAAMWKVYSDAGMLTDEAKEAEPPEDIEEEQVTFPSPQPILSEMDQLAVISKRKDLGLNTAIELIQRDNPGMSIAEAQAKLDKIRAEKMDNAAKFGTPGGPTNPTGMTSWPNPADGSKGVITAPLPDGQPAPGGAAPSGGMSGNQGQKGAGIGSKNNNGAGPGTGKPAPFGPK